VSAVAAYDEQAFAELCRQELELCAVGPGQSVAILRSGDARADYARAFMTAARQLGATSFELNIPPSGKRDDTIGILTGSALPLSHNRAAVEALKHADMIVDLIFILYEKENQELRDAGARILSCVEPVDALAKLLPTKEMRAQVEAAAELLRSAKVLRFTNKAGSDVTYQLGAYPVIEQYGFTDTPGRWDHWPSGGFLYTGGADDGVDGTVVVDVGDIVFPFNSYVQSPIQFTIRAGFVTDITGGLDAEVLADYMRGFDDPNAYGISHIGWGLERRASWASVATMQAGIGMEARCFYGSVLFSTGPNLEVGGTNETPCHFDIPMRNCSLFLDDVPVVVDGEVVAPR
jgi:2,5-dihydroxypyridine 5,6-dioxygenase